MSRIIFDRTADPSAIHVDVPTDQTVWHGLDCRLGVRNSCKGERANVYYRRSEPGSLFGPIIVRYHETDIVTAYVDGSVSFDSGGWRTYTTKERMNDFLPGFKVETTGGMLQIRMVLSSSKGVWSFGRSITDQGSTSSPYFDSMFEDGPDFFDGITLTAVGMPKDGRRIGPNPDAEILSAIDAYVDSYTDDAIRFLVTSAREDGMRGDCLYCQLRTEDGKPVPENDHLLLHIEEEYRMASLIVTALEARGYGNPAIVLSLCVDHGESGKGIRRDLRTYLRQRLAVNTTGARPTGSLERDWYGA